MSKENVKRLMSFGNTKEYPDIFSGMPSTNNQKYSKYTTSAGVVQPTNRISHTNLRFFYEMYLSNKTNDSMAIGSSVGNNICERTREDGNYEIAIYNSNDASMVCFTVTKSTNKIKLEFSPTYQVMLGSLWEDIIQDNEFYSSWIDFVDGLDKHNILFAWDAACVMTDNLYRRISLDIIPISSFNADINEVKVERQITQGAYVPTSVECGVFEFLKMPNADMNFQSVKHSEYIGKYPIDKDRVYTEEEKAMMEANRLPDSYIIDDNDVEVCRDIVNTTNTSKPFRNFIFVGPPGSGKSEKARSIANGIVLPEVIFSCNPSNEIFDFIGQVMPPSTDKLEREAWEFAAKLEELGGINYQNVAKVYGLPTMDDLIMAPDAVYYELTGEKKNKIGAVPTVSDAVRQWTVYMADKVNDAIRKLKVSMKEGAGFTFTETDFIRAIENGWLIEVQEPNVILNEGVMVGLNSLLNEGVITLQNGRTVKRHKDSVVIFTTNHNLYGLRNMNQSFIDRASEILFIEKPPVPVIADRIMSVSGLKDRKMAIEMANLGASISDAMDKEGIEDGVCEVRSLINWAIKCSYMNPYEAAINTVINKTSMDRKNRLRMLKILDESYFYQFRGK